MNEMNNLRMRLKEALDNLWARVKGMFDGLDERVTALEEGGGSGVTSVNGQTGAVVLNANDVGAKAVQSPVSDPTASGTAVSFIDTLTQDAQGVITPTKKTVPEATATAPGLMSATDKAKLDGIAAGAEVNAVDSVNGQTGAVTLDAADVSALPDTTVFVSGVKGNAENSYRHGNVNITPANIGAMPKYPASIELIPSSGGGFIDWHYNGTTADFTARLQEMSEGVLGIRAATDSAYYPIITTKDVIQKALYNTNANGITAYPTAAGLYRTTGTLPAGMPTGANAYGVLTIVGCGGYYMHQYADALGNVFIAHKGSNGAPVTWRKLTTTAVSPIS